MDKNTRDLLSEIFNFEERGVGGDPMMIAANDAADKFLALCRLEPGVGIYDLVRGSFMQQFVTLEMRRRYGQ